MEIWDHFLGDEERLIRDTARQLARDKVAPRAIAVDERAEFPDDNVAALAELGFFGLALPEAYGGPGRPRSATCWRSRSWPAPVGRPR